MSTTVYDFSVKNAKGETVDLADFKGKALLIVNTASKCGFTPQYNGLESLYKEYQEQGLEVLGFPCNQFMGQEPGDDEAIQEFCSLNFDVKFPVYAKVDVNGDNADPLFDFLKQSKKGLLGSAGIKWNFTKFLVGKDGKVIDRYAPKTEPKAIEKDIVSALSA